MRVSRRELLSLAAAGVSASCGYTLAGRGSFLPPYIQIVGIPLFGNRTPYATIEQTFTEKVRVEFQSRRFTVRPTEEGTDGVVRGDITGIGASPVSLSQQQVATRFRFTVTVAVKFDDMQQNKTLWENPALSFSDEYELSSRAGLGAGSAAFLEQERVTVDRVATDFARSVVQAILEAF
jgi:Lipopolysaccharide-assembly